MKRLFFAALVLVLGTTTQAVAGDYDDGLAAYNTGDYATAMRLWRPFAEQGYADAQFNLGYMYANGIGFPQDYAEALKWYRIAAEQGHEEAQNNLGFMYGTGKGTTQNYVMAHMWYNIAASRFPAGEDRQAAARNRDIAEGHMTPDQIGEAQRLALEWRPKTWDELSKDIDDTP